MSTSTLPTVQAPPDPYADFANLQDLSLRQSKSYWKDPIKWGGGASAAASIGSGVVAHYFFTNIVISTSAAIACGIFAQIALETTPKGLRDRVTQFNLKWSFATFLVATQIEANCLTNKGSQDSRIFCTHLNKELLFFLKVLSLTWFVGSLMSQIRRTKENDVVGGSHDQLLAHPVKMVEPNTPTSFWISKALQGGAGAALLTVSYIYPSINYLEFVDDFGAFLIGYGTIPPITRFFWQQLHKAELHHRSSSVFLEPEEASCSLKAVRIVASVCDCLSRNIIGALFIGTPVPPIALEAIYVIIGGIYGSNKFVAQQKFLALDQEDVVALRRQFRPDTSLLGKVQNCFKLFLACGIGGYLIYGMTQTPLEDEIALLSFGAMTYGSYLLTSLVDRQFCKNPQNRVLGSLHFYLVDTPDFLSLPYFAINQKMKIGSHALKGYSLTRLVLAFLAYGSLGASAGGIPARSNSPLLQREPAVTPSLSQFLAGQYIEQSFS